MSSLVRLNIHASQFPETVRGDLLDSLNARRVNHKFHYDSFKQAAKWLALHQAYSPSRTDPDCSATYDRSFEEVTKHVRGEWAHLVGLGCGGGQKDTRLLLQLAQTHKRLAYTPCDVSVPLVLTARRAALEAVPGLVCAPLVCDLSRAEDLPALLKNDLAPACEAVADGANLSVPARLFTFFGMIPNFEPDQILPRLASLVGRADVLLFSANLAPGPDYRAGVRRVLPLYDNSLTREWLMTFLLDLGVENGDGEIQFEIEEDPRAASLMRIAAYFSFGRRRELTVENHRFAFEHGARVRLFFSYRHTPELIRSLLARYGLQVIEEWVTRSGEEGVFLVSRAA